MKKAIIGVAAIVLAAAVLVAGLVSLFEARRPEQEADTGIFVTIGREDVQSIGWVTPRQTGGGCNADDTPLRQGECMKIDIDIQPGEKYTLTAYDADNAALAEAEFVGGSGRVDIALNEDGFSEAAPQ